MGKFLFVLTRGLEDPTRVTRALQLAKAAKETGHEVHMFLTDDAVFVAKDGMLDNVIAPTGDEAASHYQYLLGQKVPIYLCIPCAESRQITKEDVDASVAFAGAPKIFELGEVCKILTF
jgi:predicted peroxiredoxin